MKAKVIETGEMVDVLPYPTTYQEHGQGPDRREWCEDELEFVPNPNRPKMVSLEKVVDYLKRLTYQEYAGGPMARMLDDYEIYKLKKYMEE